MFVDLIRCVDEVLPDAGLEVWVAAESSTHQSIGTLLDKLESASPEKPVTDAPQPNLMSNFLFIFTSGTTGTVQQLYHLVEETLVY